MTEDLTEWSIRKFFRTARRRGRAIEIQANSTSLSLRIRSPDNLR